MDDKIDIKQIMLLQTDNMTFGQYEVTPIEHNILTLINEQLQGYMTNKTINRDLFGMPYVEINCDEAGGPRHKALVLKNIKSLEKKEFGYRWTYPGTDQKVSTKGEIIITCHDYEKTNRVGISLNPWAIPFLLYYGKGVGGTWYNKQLALSLRGDKAKRIYMILCSKCTTKGGVFDYSIKRFKEDFKLGPSYTNTVIKNRILEKAKEEINGIVADVWFEYELITKYPLNNKRKPMADTIRFYIHTSRQSSERHRLSTKNKKGKDFEMYRMIITTVGATQLADNIFNKIINSDRRDEIIDRFNFWHKQLITGEITAQHMKNKIKKLVNDDFGFNIE